MAARKSLFPLVFLFFFINLFLIVFRSFLEKKGFDVDVMLMGNIILCFITIISFLMLHRGMRASTTAGFLQSVYGSFIIKLFLMAGLVFGYIYLNKKDFNKPALFTCMFLYLVYTFFEIRGLVKLSRREPDA